MMTKAFTNPGVEVVESSWFKRVCALIFGKRIVAEEGKVQVVARYWRGVLYIIKVKHPYDFI